jgi:hypothetical protein
VRDRSASFHPFKIGLRRQLAGALSGPPGPWGQIAHWVRSYKGCGAPADLECLPGPP